MTDRSFRAILPLTRKVRLDPGELITELRLFVEQSGASVRMDPRMMTRPDRPSGGLRGLLGGAQPERVLFEIDGVRMRVQMVHQPFERRDRIHRFVNPANWTRGLGEFADHRAHVLIHEAGIEGEEGPDAVFDRAAAVTATAAVVARLTRPVGVAWMAAHNALPMPMFREAMEELTEGLAPLRLWVRWHMIPPDEMQEASPGLVTHGLAPFIGRELLAKPSQVESHRLIELAFALARSLVDERVGLGERDHLTLDDGTELDIRLRGPGTHSEVPVYEFEVPGMQAPPPRERAADPLAMPSVPGRQQGESEQDRLGRIAAMLGLGGDRDEDEAMPLPYIPPPPGLSESGTGPEAVPGTATTSEPRDGAGLASPAAAGGGGPVPAGGGVGAESAERGAQGQAGSQRGAGGVPPAPPFDAATTDDRERGPSDAADEPGSTNEPAPPEELARLEPPQMTADGQRAPEPGARSGEVRDYAVAGGRRIRVISGGRAGS